MASLLFFISGISYSSTLDPLFSGFFVFLSSFKGDPPIFGYILRKILTFPDFSKNIPCKICFSFWGRQDSPNPFVVLSFSH